MFIRRACCAASIFALAACASNGNTGEPSGQPTSQQAEPDYSNADIANIAKVKSGFGPQFRVTEVPRTGIDPRLLTPQRVPPGLTFDPADCAKLATGQVLPPDLKGNMAATSAEGEGNRFIAIAVETSAPVPITDPGQGCRKVAFTGPSLSGLVELVDAPQIDGVHTIGIRRMVQTTIAGQTRTGEVYNYVAGFGPFLVIVTANALVQPGQPVGPVNTQRAEELVTAAVAAVKG